MLDTMMLDPAPAARLARARASLTGLSVGDAFGEAAMGKIHRVGERRTPSHRPWRWTDDTAMALSIVDALADRGDIEPDDLARRFADRYAAEPWRGYGGGAHRILAQIGDGVPWQVAAAAAFGGGSMGNGAAMRVAPLGAYFADDLDAAVAAAARSARPTHAHPDGVAGAVAIAVAAAAAARGDDGAALVAEVLARTPPGDTRDALARAARFSLDADPFTVASAVGNGARVIASDTVPFCVWAAARHLADYAEALWTTASVLGDMDTTCAIVGGVVVLAAGAETIPAAWLDAREALPP
jgi:ADP-ribosylglycohydrolase